MSFSTPREELAWAAGLFDGEGHVSRKQGTDFVLDVAQVDRRVLDRFAEAVGVGGIVGPYKRGARSPIHHYRVGGHPKVQAICAMLWQWLSPVKREQFKTALTSMALRAHRRFNGPCAHGVGRTKNCRECQRVYMQRHLAKPRALVRPYHRAV